MRISFLLIALAGILFTGCPGDDGGDLPPLPKDINFRQEMRDFVTDLAGWSRLSNPDFIVIPQNGEELLTSLGEPVTSDETAYLASITGQGREDLFYGYEKDNKETPSTETAYILDFLKKGQSAGVTILVTDYCSTESKVDDSYEKNDANGFISFAADSRELDRIPTYPSPIHNHSTGNITALSDVKNFLYLINPDRFSSKSDFINAVSNTDYDLIIMDLFFNETAFTNTEIQQLKKKKSGGSRLVVCYMSIGEAEDYRFYWNTSWTPGSPSWIREVNPDWAGNYKVQYWDQNWQNIIFGEPDSYLAKVLNAGFDGVYLDIIDGYEYFE